PWPAETNGLNWWFVRVTWGESAAAVYQDLPTYADMASPAALHHINLAYNILHGGRPERIEIVPGGVPRDDTLFVALTGHPELGLAIGGVD
ncbi:MAG: hypothetical protein JW910_18805, partial [Anaerolineae bacterium]|nr:hypothetical protein [Anaerolineae bacterium]